jgi:vitamin K-dependent gamma-carboxylase
MIQTRPISRSDTIQSAVLPWSRLFAPVDSASLAVFRMGFGAVMMWEVWRYFTYGWISAYYIQPGFYFSYYGFEWVKPWPGIGMYVHFTLLGVLALCILLGLFYRFSTMLFFLGFSYIFLLDQSRYLNHFYLVALISFLLIFVPANRLWSLDAWRKPDSRSDVVPRWSLWLLRAQIGMVYFFGGIAKLNEDWLHGEPMRMWLAERSSFPLIGHLFTEEWMVYLFSYGGLLFDLSFVPLVLWRRTRWLALAIGLIFHLTNARLFTIGIFPWFMLAASLLFLDPAWPRLRWLRGTDAQNKADESSSRSLILSRRQTFTLALIGLYVSWQVLMPLRHFLYPGDVSWTEEGHRFSWHMKLRDKSGNGEFWATDVQTRTNWKINPAQYINDDQFDEMIANPDMILQFAQHVAEQQRLMGEGEIEVRAWVTSSLNGRPSQFLIDPVVNLTAQPRVLTALDWIVPLHDPA